MFELIFGIVWIIISSSVFIPFLIVEESMPKEVNVFSTMNPMLIIMAILFYGIGIFLVVKGAKKLIKDKKTEKNGEECYGIVESTNTTGAYVNGRPEYEALVQIYISSQNKTERITEKIGFDYNKYPIGSYVKVKYYNGDINIKEKVDSNYIGEPARSYLKPVSTIENSEIAVKTVSADEVEINGVKYKKVD